MSFEHFYTCNEVSPEAIYLEKANSFQLGYIFDEGFLKGTVALEANTLRLKLRTRLRDLLNFSKKRRFNNPVYNILYSNDAQFFKSYLKDTKMQIISLDRYSKHIQFINLGDYYNLEQVIFQMFLKLKVNN